MLHMQHRFGPIFIPFEAWDSTRRCATFAKLTWAPHRRGFQLPDYEITQLRNSNDQRPAPFFQWYLQFTRRWIFTPHHHPIHAFHMCTVKFLFLGSLCLLLTLSVPASPQSANEKAAVSQRDGQHDFDFEIGSWKTHVRRLLHPLSGSSSWAEYDGTSVVRKVLDGSGNLVELNVEGPAGRIEGVSLRLYNPQSRQWSLNYANRNSGTLSTPTIGEFRNGRGKFYDQETLNGRAILVRFIISGITSNSCHFEQSFSSDGGKTWEVNWIATDTRIE